MANFNRIILLGNLCHSPELKWTESKLAVCRIRLAVNEKYGKGDDQKERTLFIDCTAFGRTAEVMEKYLEKGRAVLIEGRLVLEQWEAKDGGKRSKHSVTVDRCQFLGGKDDNAEEREPVKATASRGEQMGLDEDQIPF